MSKTNEDVLRSFLALWATRDAQAMTGHFAVDGVYDNVPDNKPMVGHEAIKQWLEGVFTQLSRIEVNLLHVADNGEWILSERLDDHIAGEKHMPLQVMNACRIVDGKITMFRDYYDMDTVRNLGMG